MVGRVRPDLDDSWATPMIVHESRTHVVVATEIPKSALSQHRRILESLLAIAAGFESLGAVAEGDAQGGRRLMIRWPCWWIAGGTLAIDVVARYLV